MQGHARFSARALFESAAALLMLGWALGLPAQDSLGDPRAYSKEPAGISLDQFAKLSGAALLAQDTGAAAAPTVSAAPVEKNPLMTGWNITGHLQTAYTWNFNQPQNDPLVDTDGDGVPDTRLPTFDGGSKENLGRVFDSEHNDFLMQQAMVTVEKATSDDHVLGLKVTVLAGHDAKFIHTPGLNDGEDIDILDAHFKIRIPSDVKFFGGGELIVGKFQTILGAEVIPATANTMYSRSMCFGFAIPFAHVGALYSQDVLKREDGNALLGLAFGVVNSAAGRAEDNNDAKAFLGQARLSPLSNLKLYANTVIGNEPIATSSSEDGNTRIILDLIADIAMPDDVPDLLKPLTFLLNYDVGGQEDGDPAGGSAKWYGFSGIAKYQINKQWYAAVRGEAYRDSESFTLGLADSDGDGAEDFMALTATVAYLPWENLQLRAEFRHDKADAQVFIDNDDHLDNHQNTLSFDAILKF
jgi:hypothetical protein